MYITNITIVIIISSSSIVIMFYDCVYHHYDCVYYSTVYYYSMLRYVRRPDHRSGSREEFEEHMKEVVVCRVACVEPMRTGAWLCAVEWCVQSGMCKPY